MARSSRIHQKLDVFRPFLIMTDLSKHHDPVRLTICVRQAMYTTSTTGTYIVCFFLLRTFACKVTDLATAMASTFLLGVTILGFCALSLAFLAFLSFSHFLCCRSDANKPSRSDPSSRTRDRQHPSRVRSDPLALDLTGSSLPWPLLELQLPRPRVVHSRVQEQMCTQRGIWQGM